MPAVLDDEMGRVREAAPDRFRLRGRSVGVERPADEEHRDLAADGLAEADRMLLAAVERSNRGDGDGTVGAIVMSLRGDL